MNHFLSEMVILGIDHNQDFLKNILSHKDFITGNYNTHFVKNNLNNLNSNNEESLSPFIICASLHDWENRNKKRILLKGLTSGWRNNFFEDQKSSYILSNNDEIQYNYKFISFNNFDFKIIDNNYKVELIDSSEKLITIEINNEIFKFYIIEKGNKIFIKNNKLGNFKLLKKDQYPIPKSSINEGNYLAPMPSLIINVLVKKGQKIKKNDPLIVISSMKMESTITALKDGKVESILVKENQNVDASTELIKII
jgi:acetyl/propionyl-CoA carboxylase alpha subunit